MEGTQGAPGTQGLPPGIQDPAGVQLPAPPGAGQAGGVGLVQVAQTDAAGQVVIQNNGANTTSVQPTNIPNAVAAVSLSDNKSSPMMDTLKKIAPYALVIIGFICVIGSVPLIPISGGGGIALLVAGILMVIGGVKWLENPMNEKKADDNTPDNKDPQLTLTPNNATTQVGLTPTPPAGKPPPAPAVSIKPALTDKLISLKEQEFKLRGLENQLKNAESQDEIAALKQEVKEQQALVDKMREEKQTRIIAAKQEVEDINAVLKALYANHDAGDESPEIMSEIEKAEAKLEEAANKFIRLGGKLEGP